MKFKKHTGLFRSTLFSILFFSIPSAWAATITVTSLADGIAGDCTLRDAITAANTNFAFNACVGGDAGQDTINFMVNGTINLGSALPSLQSNITINGPGNLIVSGATASATVLDVTGTNVIISGLTITGGNSGTFGGGLRVNVAAEAQVSDLSINANNATNGGGGIYNAGTLTLSNVTVSNNSAGSNGGGIYNTNILSISDSMVSNNSVSGGNGAGIYNEGTINNFTGNTVGSNTGASFGGGIYSNTNITVNESTVTVNIASDSGGGIYSAGGATVEDSTVSSNTATNNDGGGINAATITLTRSLVSGNTSGRAGGGLNAGTYTITNSTLSDNNSDWGGAAYLGGSAALTLLNSTVTLNDATTEGGGIWSAGTVNFTNSIISANTASNCQGPVTATWNSFDYNIDSADTCGLGNTNDQPNTNPMLASLQNNGGPTLTHALLAGSPAIDMANNATCTATDQRGALRPQDGDNDMTATCDIGAFEVGVLPPPSSPTGNFGEGGCFIATAAFGTAMAKDVRYLRAFRDQYLLTNAVGRKFVSLYYEYSPAMADKLREHDTLRSVVRGLLKPLVWMSKAIVDEDIYEQQTQHHP